MERKHIIWNTDWETVAIALVLMLTGIILVGGDYVGVLSLDRIQNYWPLALIAIGLTELAPLSGEKQL